MNKGDKVAVKNKFEELDAKEDLLMIKLHSDVKLQPFLDRYTKLIDLADRFGDDQYAREHSNGIVIFGITNNHKIIKEQLKIKELEFKILDNKPKTLQGQLSGKKKVDFFKNNFLAGGVSLNSRTTLLIIHCENGEEFEIKSGINGSLVELNERFIDNPNMILESVKLFF